MQGPQTTTAYAPPLPAPEPRLSFSRHEVLHLVGAVVMLTLAFSFVLNVPQDGATGSSGIKGRLQVPPILLLASFLAVSSGFVLHELAHKVLAQRYGHWAEFRAQFTGLAISVAIALGFGFLFAAPGAVHIWGRVTLRENGLISLMGPLTNLVIAAIALPWVFTPDTETTGFQIALVVTRVNSVLAVFNLIPVGPLDGKKILRWNKPIYALAMLLGLTLTVFAFLGAPN